VENKSQVDDPGKEWQLGIMRAIERTMSPAKRRRTFNWVLVQEYLLSHTSKGGSTSSAKHCEWLGVNPDGYTFFDKGKPAREIIKALRKQGYDEMKTLQFADQDKLKAITREIAKACRVTTRTINNWACGASSPGQARMELLRLYSERRGVK
jgi:hypothetical protein